jgi:hypothetical protein
MMIQRSALVVVASILMRRWVVLGALVGGVACADDGAVRLRLVGPEVAELSPLDDRLASLTLIIEADGRPPEVVTRDLGGSPLELGEVPVGDGVRISLLGTSSSGRMVGFARTAAPLSVSASEVVEVSLQLRRPFAYVAGGTRLWSMDTTVEPGAVYGTSLEVPDPPVALAPTPDGREVVVVADSTVSLLSTSNHQVDDASVALIDGGAHDVAVSPDGRWAVVTHTDGVTVVNLDALRGGIPQATFVTVDSPGAVAVTTDTAFVLTDAAARDSCGTASGILPISLADATPGTAKPLGTPARDLAVDGRGRVLVAAPCRDQVLLVDLVLDATTDLLEVPEAASVAVAGGRVWASGRVVARDGAHNVLVSADLSGANRSRIDFPPSEAKVQSDDLTEPGQSQEARLTADDVDPYDLAVLPDGAHVVVLSYGRYHADEVVRTVVVLGIESDEVIVPALDAETWEYVLVDATSGAAVQRMRTRCTVEWEAGVAFLDNWSCARGPDEDSSAQSFEPTHIGVLYGER